MKDATFYPSRFRGLCLPFAVSNIHRGIHLDITFRGARSSLSADSVLVSYTTYTGHTLTQLLKATIRTLPICES